MTPSPSSPLSPLEIELAEIQYALSGAGEGLDSFIRRISPTRQPPPHIVPVIRAIERARHERIRLCLSMPPRHAKTITILHSIAWWLRSIPGDTCAYFTYSDTRGRSKSRLCRAMALLAGAEIASDAANMGEWRTAQGGGLIAGGVGGGLTGVGVSGLMVVDDAFKNREEADSTLIREKVWEWFAEVAVTRLEGASALVVGTRWHEDDLIGRLVKAGGWEVINMPALSDDGEALWPDRFPVPELASIRKIIGEYSFAALYQGQPRPRGANLFGPPTYYDPATLRLDGLRICIAADPAASIKTTADYSAAIVLATQGDGDSQIGYVLNVIRSQTTIPAFARELLALQRSHGNASLHVESVGGFKATPQILRELSPGIRVHEIRPMGDKFQRAQGAAAAWNQGRLRVPKGAPWLNAFLNELGSFTGVNDAHDDQVDCLSHAWNESARPPVMRAL